MRYGEDGHPASQSFDERGLLPKGIRKLALLPEIVRARVRQYSRVETVNSSPAAVLDALDLRVLHQVAFWDALILQAARQSGCFRLLTGDLQTGVVIGGVRIVNPFEAVPKRCGSKGR